MKRNTVGLKPTTPKELSTPKTSSFNEKKLTRTSFKKSQTVVGPLVNEILENFFKVVEELNLQTYAHNVADQIKEKAFSVQQILFPQQFQIQNDSLFAPERQPKRIEFDPICGFDRLVTIPNKNMKVLKSAKSLKIPSIGTIVKAKIENQNFERKSKLIPLNSIFPLIEKDEICPLAERDRKLYETRTLLMQPPSYKRQNQSLKEKKLLSQAESNQKVPEEYFYGFEGEKEMIVPGNNSNGRKNYSFGGNKILKTAYKVNNQHTDKKNRFSSNGVSQLLKKTSKNTQRSTLMLKEHFRQRKESFGMKLLSSHNNCDESKFKVMIEAELKKSHHSSSLKWKFKPQKLVSEKN